MKEIMDNGPVQGEPDLDINLFFFFFLHLRFPPRVSSPPKASDTDT